MNPAWHDIEHAFLQLFERQWYTNQGPLANEFENALQNWLNIEEAVCVVNPAIGMTMALECLNIQTIYHPAQPLSLRLHNALRWAQLKSSTLATADALLLEPAELHATHADLPDVPWVVDASDVHNPAELAQSVRRFKRDHSTPWLMVLSFETGQTIEAQGAACIASDCAHTAELLRNIRSSYGVRKPLEVVKTANGRMSEAQAAFGLLSLNMQQEFRP